MSKGRLQQILDLSCGIDPNENNKVKNIKHNEQILTFADIISTSLVYCNNI